MSKDTSQIRKLLSAPFYHLCPKEKLLSIVTRFLEESQIIPSTGRIKLAHLVAINEFFDACKLENVFSEQNHKFLNDQIMSISNDRYLNQNFVASPSLQPIPESTVTPDQPTTPEEPIKMELSSTSHSIFSLQDPIPPRFSAPNPITTFPLEPIATTAITPSEHIFYFPPLPIIPATSTSTSTTMGPPANTFTTTSAPSSFKVPEKSKMPSKKLHRATGFDYCAFAKQNHQTISKENPGSSPQVLAKILGARWRAMSAEEKELYAKPVKQVKLKEKPKLKLKPRAQAYNLWRIKTQAMLQQHTPKLSAKKMNKELGKMWKALSEEEKRQWEVTQEIQKNSQNPTL